jgi:predicted kinase
MSYYTVIRGPLGIGKTTISNALARVLAGHLVSIDAILDQHNLEEWEAGYISERSFLRANDFAIAEARPVLGRGTPVIFDGNFYHRTSIDDLARRLDFPHAVFTLKAPVAVCLERDRDRPVSFGEESVRDVYAKVSELDYGIDVDARGPVSEIVPEIVRRLAELPRRAD